VECYGLESMFSTSHQQLIIYQEHSGVGRGLTTQLCFVNDCSNTSV